MARRIGICSLSLVLLCVSGAAPATKPAFTPTADYTRKTIRGWSVLVNDDLLAKHPKLAADCLIYESPGAEKGAWDRFRIRSWRIWRAPARSPTQLWCGAPAWKDGSRTFGPGPRRTFADQLFLEYV